MARTPEYFTHTSHSLPDLLSAWVRHQIQKSSVLHPIHPLHIEQENKRLMIRLIIDQPGARYLLLLEEQTVSPPPLHLLGLSAREAQVLLCVMHGKDNQAIAHDLEIHSSAVRKHLENIHRKLDVQSRTEAIAQVLERLEMLNVLPSP
ncbi:helix-turn-helix transcriptional regulator [Cyanobacteria bacterium FACHB-63]|nr:helix-turn-helix transcriptional regulator [Cyanobacteria bacterium FACHB-63]